MNIMFGINNKPHIHWNKGKTQNTSTPWEQIDKNEVISKKKVIQCQLKEESVIIKIIHIK